jgi:Arc/MetJ family transcription regulator
LLEGNPIDVYDRVKSYTSRAGMRTNIDIDDDLLKQAMKASGLKTKKAVVEQALEQFVREKRARKALEDLRGIGWEGDLDAMRRSFMPVDEE